MIYTRTTQHAMVALAEMVHRFPGHRVLLADLIEGTDLPAAFIAKIFQHLVHKGILDAVNGRGGGYALTRPADQVTLLDIVEVVEGPEHLDRCVVGLATCDDTAACPIHDLYKPIRQRIKDYLRTTTLEDLAVAAKQRPTARRRRGGRSTRRRIASS